MRNKLLIGAIIILGAVSLTGCGTSSSKINVADDLNKDYKNCLDQNEPYICKMNWTFQEYLNTYSNYQLLNTSLKEFTTKPKEANSLFTYGSSRDSICAYKYALFYNKETKDYYQVELGCNGNEDNPTFKNETLLK